LNWAELGEIERKIGPWKEGTPRLEATSMGHLKKGLRYLYQQRTFCFRKQEGETLLLRGQRLQSNSGDQKERRTPE
jgi:hypothetical protein